MSAPICKGSYLLLSACTMCERCKNEEGELRAKGMWPVGKLPSMGITVVSAPPARVDSTSDARHIARVDSSSVDRIANNVVRHEYRDLSDAEKAQMLALKDMGVAFIAKCEEIGKTRELSIAITKMEEAVMWAVKSVTT